MDRKQALNQLRIMQAWHEDFGDGPNADYDAICYAIGVIEEAPKELDTLIKALEAEHKKLIELQSKVGTNLAEVGTRAVRGYPIDADALMEKVAEEYGERARDRLYQIIRYMPPAQPETATVTIGRTKGGVIMWYECDACGEPVDQKDNYCRNCGRKLKHE